jgi:Ni,Fe-hydrogenase III component G
MTRAEGATWMETIHDDIRDAYIQHDLFWQFQDMIRENERLANSQSVFLYWLNMLFKDSIVMAVRRQIDRDNKSISLFAGSSRTRPSQFWSERRISWFYGTAGR